MLSDFLLCPEAGAGTNRTELSPDPICGTGWRAKPLHGH